MDSKTRALLMCTLMIASALAGCLGGSDDDGGDEDVMGCTYADATNYNPDATKDDGTCSYAEPEPEPEPVMGCTDPAASNHNAAAEVDDASCDYGRSHADIMADYAAGTIDFGQASYELEVSRKCREQGSNNPCEIVEMSIGDASTIDPHDAYDSASGDVIEQVYDTLYRYAGDGTGNAIIEARLATGLLSQ